MAVPCYSLNEINGKNELKHFLNKEKKKHHSSCPSLEGTILSCGLYILIIRCGKFI